MICKHILLINTIKWSNSSISINSIWQGFQMLLYITDDLIRHKSFIYTRLNGQWVLISNNSIYHKSFVFTQFKCQTFLFDSFISGPITPSQSRPRSDGNKGILRIPLSSSITGASPTYCLMSYPGYSSAGMQSVYSAAPADWGCKKLEDFCKTKRS